MRRAAERHKAQQAERLLADRDRWRAECWAIYLATGADPDGDDPRHLNPGEALRAVEELRASADRPADRVYAVASADDADDWIDEVRADLEVDCG